MTNIAIAGRAAGRAVRRVVTGPGAAARIGAALVLVGTLSAQHPNPSFGRIARRDTFSAFLPNWRFFAPNPAQHDYHFFYRTLNTAGETSGWRPVEVIAGRRLHQILWFPGRRPEKAIFDIGTELLITLDKGFDALTRLPAYRMLVGFLRDEIARGEERGSRDGNPEHAVKGFQFTLARAAGYDDSEEPEVIFVSPYTPMRPGAPAAAELREAA
ncbi:hypothetical protein GCM10027160_07420 [Streptomyces calidiresistens]|uniref:Uncharacterized protein n=1 Tax=Streptomyces calidiresistens TaxID=1485586 RepID=A0A7W3XYM0_9ACTN|nr:hypothetical protein [Streptomyces calidiresistens]MBB0231982.1 hypothetical protein [Streptomyces calidiresistens]